MNRYWQAAPRRSTAYNGVDGSTGQWLFSRGRESGAEGHCGERYDAGVIRWLRRLVERLRVPHLGLPIDIDPAEPVQAGWGVVYHRGEDAEVIAALRPLIEHRQRQLGTRRVKELWYRQGESFGSWLARHDSEPGTVAPERVPCYLVLVGPPTRIPFRFQFPLSIEYEVGRLCFETPADYARYTASVIDYETAATVATRRTVAYFATRHDGDDVTETIHDSLAAPLARGEDDPDGDVAGRYDFATRELLGDDAAKANLVELLAGREDGRPAVLFTATHGLGWPTDDPRQRSAQGALVCQDWPVGVPVQRGHFMAAEDLATARVHGMVSFHFACYSCATPRFGHFRHGGAKAGGEIAQEPFVAALPQALLAHPQGGALAAIGHLDRAWAYSVIGASGIAQRQPFVNALERILRGLPVGYALRDFRHRYASLTVRLDEIEEQQMFGIEAASETELIALRNERNDARNYLLLGDPAVRLRPAAMS